MAIIDRRPVRAPKCQAKAEEISTERFSKWRLTDSSAPRSHAKVEEVTMEEFKKWLLRNFDENGDGRISVEELRDAIRYSGGWFSSWRAKRVLKAVDSNSNGFIDDSEMSKLVIFAQKQFGLKVVGF